MVQSSLAMIVVSLHVPNALPGYPRVAVRHPDLANYVVHIHFLSTPMLCGQLAYNASARRPTTPKAPPIIAPCVLAAPELVAATVALVADPALP